MNKIMLVFVAALSLVTIAGCKKKGGSDEAVKKMTEFKDAMCKCKAGDTACANKVLEDQKKYGEEMAKGADKDAKPDPDMAKKMEPIMTEYTKCSTAAMTPATPPAGGDMKAGGDGSAAPAGDMKKEEEKKEEVKEEKKEEEKK